MSTINIPWVTLFHFRIMFITIIWVVIAILSLVLYLRQIYSKLSNAGVNHLPVIPFFGHMFWALIKYENMVETLMRNVSAFPEDKIVGQYETISPVYIVKDIELIKRVTIKDFEHFVDRRNFTTEADPFFGRGLLLLKGDEWKEMRSTLSPAFTSSKIRLMVPFMVEVGDAMITNLRRKINDSKNGYIDINIKDLTTRYANDVIASCAFGLKVDSQSADNEFYMHSREATRFSLFQIIKLFICRDLPTIARMLNLTVSSVNATNFFKNVVLSTMKQRETKNIVRHDMINILQEVKKGKLVHDKEEDANAGFATVQESNVGKKQYNREWTDNDLVAQAALFLLAGFDTVSTAMTFIIHELALHPDIQERLVQEIKEYDTNNGGKIDFNIIQSMKYLDMVVSEGLRLYPPAPLMDRKCVKDYNFGRVNKTSTKDLIVRKGDTVEFPIWAFHRDPELFPDPHKFDPERFSDENKHNIKPFSYMPFGLGPRNCIGSRFALCEVKVMLYQLLRDMRLSPCNKTVIPTQLVGGVIMNIKGGGWIRIEAREKK